MIKVRSQPKIEVDPRGGWQLVLWTGTPFDYATPFQSMLSEIAEALGQDGRHDLDLPAYEDGEDFIEGTLRFGTSLLQVYYEHSLSYLQLKSDTEDTIHDVGHRLGSRIIVV